MRKAAGIILETSLDTGDVKEYDTYQCKHCGKHVIAWKHARTASDAGGHFCSHCAGMICPQCAAQGDCDPLREKLERWAMQELRFQNLKEL